MTILIQPEQEHKTIQTILYLVRNSLNLNKYTLSKLIYYTDAFHYQKNTTTITQKHFIHVEKAPLPEGINEILSYMVSHNLMQIRPHVQGGKVAGMVFDAAQAPDPKSFNNKELKTLRYVTMLLGKKIQDESRIFPRLYEHYIITDLFSVVDFSSLPTERPPKMKKRRRLIAIGDKIYKILFEGY